MKEVLYRPRVEQPYSSFVVCVPDTPVTRQVKHSLECAKKRTEIDMACQFFGLSRRHAAQRFRRWFERQQKADK